MLNKNFEKLVAEDIDEKLSETEENYAKNFDVNAIYYNVLNCYRSGRRKECVV